MRVGSFHEVGHFDDVTVASAPTAGKQTQFPFLENLLHGGEGRVNHLTQILRPRGAASGGEIERSAR